MICDRFFYYPNRHNYGSPDNHGIRYESVSFPTSDGLKLNGWFFPAQAESPDLRSFRARSASEGSSVFQQPTGQGGQDAARLSARDEARPPRASRGTVLHLHGNAGNMTGHFQHVAWLPAAGWNVLCFDYRGYGKSQGRISRDGAIADARAALDYLLGRPDVDPGRIVAFGQSLGGAIGIVLTAERPEIRALATDGAFDSYRRVAAWHIRHSPWLLPIAWWVPYVLMARGYNPIDYIGRIAPRPILIIHGTADGIVPVHMAHTLYAAAREPKQLWLVDGADHYDPLRNSEAEGRAKLVSFFESTTAG